MSKLFLNTKSKVLSYFLKDEANINLKSVIHRVGKLIK